jgi:hypothetical protein
MSSKISTGIERLASLHLAAALLALVAFAPAANAQGDGWRFGLGTGFSSFSLDGDIGFGTDEGGVIVDVDLDNGDTADLFESAFGFAGFAAKGRWTLNFSYGTVTLEDSDAGFDAEWDKAMGELSAVYHFAETGSHRWGALFGARMTDHEWKFKNKSTGLKADPEDDWLDAIVGLTHSVPISDNWTWANRAEYAFGDSEGSYYLTTALNWRPLEHWVFNVNARYIDVEYGDEDDINDNDFYYYDVEEPSIGLGFMYIW